MRMLKKSLKMCVVYLEMSSSDFSEPDITDEAADSVYSNLATLLTALQSVRPAGHTLDTCLVNCLRCSFIDNITY